MSDIPKKLQQLRTARRLSMIAVAKAIDVAPSTYREWEYNRAIPAEHLAKLTKFYQITAEDIIGNSPSDLTPEQRIQRVIDDLHVLRDHLQSNSRKKI